MPSIFFYPFCSLEKSINLCGSKKVIDPMLNNRLFPFFMKEIQEEFLIPIYQTLKYSVILFFNVCLCDSTIILVQICSCCTFVEKLLLFKIRQIDLFQ